MSWNDVGSSESFVEEGLFRSIEDYRIQKDCRFVDDAVRAVARKYRPKAIYIYGPSAAGYVDHDRRVDMLVIITKGDSMEIKDGVKGILYDMDMLPNVKVVTTETFEEYRDEPFSTSYMAVSTGYVAYES